NEQHREPRRVDAENGKRLLHAADLALVVGAPDVDDLGEAALLELVPVIEDVGPEVGRVSITLDDNLILSAVGLEPGGPVVLDDSPERSQLRHRVLVPSCVQAALEKEP